MMPGLVRLRRLSLVLLLAWTVAAWLPSARAALSPTQDTDGDRLADIEEDANRNDIVDTGETDPYNADTDGGGEADGSEIAAKRNPFDPTDDMTNDTDQDGWVNGIELLRNTDPKNPDTDGDGIIDSKDPFPLDSRYGKDRNQNNLPDEWESQTGLLSRQVTPTRSDDPDGDGLTNAEEFARGTDPLTADTDRDGIADKTEIDQGNNPNENACLELNTAATPFNDTESHWAVENIEHIHQIVILPGRLPLVQGYRQSASGSAPFRPDQPVTRFEFLKMVLLSTCTPLSVNTGDMRKSFKDIAMTGTRDEPPDAAFRRKVIYTAVQLDVVEGYEDNTFRPDTPVNRAEAVKILMGAAKLPSLSEAENAKQFPDVSSDAWFLSPLSEAGTRKIVRGYDDGLFRPENLITRAEAATIVERTIRQNPTINGYVLPAE